MERSVFTNLVIYLPCLRRAAAMQVYFWIIQSAVNYDNGSLDPVLYTSYVIARYFSEAAKINIFFCVPATKIFLAL